MFAFLSFLRAYPHAPVLFTADQVPVVAIVIRLLGFRRSAGLWSACCPCTHRRLLQVSTQVWNQRSEAGELIYINLFCVCTLKGVIHSIFVSFCVVFCCLQLFIHLHFQAEETYPVDQENQGNTLVSVAPLNPPPETPEKPSVNGESPEVVKTEPTPPTNGHSTTNTADTEMWKSSQHTSSLPPSLPPSLFPPSLTHAHTHTQTQVPL